MDGFQGAGGPESPFPVVKPPDKCRRDEWNEGGVLSLLEVYESKWILRNRAKLKGSDWEEIAHQVSIKCSGTKNLKTPSQCKNKIESMKKRYRAESAIAHRAASCSSWQFFARMDSLLKGAVNSTSQLKSDNNIDLQSPPKVEVELELDCQLHDSNPDDGSNTLPIDVNAIVNANHDENKQKESRGTDSDVSAPRSKLANAGDGEERTENPCKKRKGSGSEVAESIRLLAHSILKIEQARMEMYKESERMRAEAEIKRGEMELKKTEIVAKTQLQIAKLFLKSSCTKIKTNDNSSSRDELDMIPRRERMDD